MPLNLGQQELSYCKQIARQLRTQYVDGNRVTLKSRLGSFKVIENGIIG